MGDEAKCRTSLVTALDPSPKRNFGEPTSRYRSFLVRRPGQGELAMTADLGRRSFVTWFGVAASPDCRPLGAT
jgi:hypothetical protein